MKNKLNILHGLIIPFAIVVLIAVLGQTASAASITSNAAGSWSASAWPNTTRTGTITTLTTSKTVTGVGTAFTTEISVGNIIKTTGNVTIGTVASIESNTSLTLAATAASANSGISYNVQGVGPGDAVTLAGGYSVIVDGNYTCASLTTAAPTGTRTLTIGTYALTVTGAVSMTMPTGGTRSFSIVVGTGTLNAGSIAIPGSTTTGQNCIVSVSTGTITVGGNITFSGTAAQAQLTFSGAGTLNITGNLGTGGTFTCSTGTVNFNGTTAQTFAGYTYYILKSNNTAGVTPVAAATITTLTLADVTASSVFNDGGYTISTATTLNLNSGTYNCTAASFPWTTLTAGTGTVDYKSATAAQTIKGTTYYNLTIDKSGQIGTLGAATTVSHNLAVMNGTLADGGYQITGNATGTLSVANGATLQIGAGTNTTEIFPTLFTTANITLGATSTVNYNWITGTTQVVAGPVGSVGPNTYGNLTVTGASGTKTLASAVTVAGNLTIATAGETFADGGYTITVNGNVTNNATHSGAGKILLSGGSASHTVTGTTDTYGILELNDANGATFANTTTTTTVGTLTITAGTLTLNSFATSLTVTTTNVTGTLTFNNATGTRSMGAVTVNTTGTVNISTAPSPLTVNDLTVNGIWSNSINAAVSVGGNLTVNTGATFTAGSGTYTFSGTTKTIGGTIGTISIPSISVSGTVTNNLTTAPGLYISTTLAGTGTLSNSSTGTLNINGTCSVTTLTNNGIVNSSGTGAITSTTVTNNLTWNMSGTGAVTAFTNAAAGTLYISSSTVPTFTTLTATATGNTVVYNGGTQTVKGTTYYNLTSSASTSATLGAATTVNYNLSVLSGILADGGRQITGNATGTLSVASGATLQIGAAGANTETFPTAFTTAHIALDPASTVIYNSTSTMTVAGSVTSVGPSTYGNLTLLGNSTKTAASAITVAGNLTINAGTFVAGTTLSVGGDWTNNGTFTPGTGTVIFNGTVSQNINGTTTSQTLYNLTLNQTSGMSVTPACTLTVSNILTLTSGILDIGNYNLLLTNTTTSALAGTFSATSMIQTSGTGYVQKTGGGYGAPGLNIVYPVGAGGYYNPFDLSGGFTATSGTGGTLQISATVSNQGANALSKYWTLAVTTYAGITSSLKFTYDNAEVRGSKSKYDIWYNGGSWVSAPGTHLAVGSNPFGTSVSAVTAAAISGKWTAGSSTPATSVSYYSYQSGDWDAATSWTIDPSGTLWMNSGIPGSTDNVTILNGRTITINANTKTINTLTLNQGSILDIQSYTGHAFGTVTGQGKIKLSSNTFPGGTFTSFVASGGGTIEYYNLNGVSLSTTQFTYNNLIVSNYTTSVITSFLINSASPTTYVVNGNLSLKNYSTGTDTLFFGNPTASDNLINMTVYGDLTVDAGCHIRVNKFASAHTTPPAGTTNNTTAYPVHTLNLYGNLTNNGSVRFTGLPSPVNTAYYTYTSTAVGTIYYGDVQVFFYGATNNTIICNGVTDFYRLIVAKGTDNTYTLEVSSSDTNNFALYAPNNQGNSAFNGGPEGYGYGAYYKALFIHYGTLKLDENIVIPSLTESGQDFNVIPTAGLWINGANVSTTVSGLNGTGYQAATLYGTLRVSGGTFSTGDAAGIVLGTLGTPVIQIEGTGILDVSQLWASTGTNLMSYIQTGGTANFRMQGENHTGSMLGLSSTNSVFVMSGGVMNFTDYAFIDATTDYQILDIESQAGAYQVTGGTINFNLPSSSTSYTANSTVPFYNLNVSRRTVGSTGSTVTIQWNTPGTVLNVLNDLTIGSNTVLNLNTNSIDLAVGENFTIASGGTYTPATATASTTTFNGSGAQLFYNIGTITGAALNNLTITNSSVTSIITNNVTVNGVLTINANAAFNDSGKYVYAKGNIVINGTQTGQQSAGGIRLTGTTAQTISGNGTGVFHNLIIDKSNTTGVSLLADASITGNLRLINNANFNIGANNLSFGAQANVYTDSLTTQSFDSTHMISTSGAASNGGVSKTFSSSSRFFLYPLGAGTSYRPASVQFTSDPTQYGSITISPALLSHPLIQSAGKAIKLYWKTTSSGFTGIQSNSINQIYYYRAWDAPTSTDEVNYIPAAYIAPSWQAISDTSAVVNYKAPREIHFNTVNYIDGEYTCGTVAAFTGLITYYSNSNNTNVTSLAGADWSTASTWCTGSNTGTPAAALADTMSNAVFVIGDGSATIHKINISGSHHVITGNLSILSDGTLDIGATQGHNFGGIPNTIVAGNGILRIASSGYFPTGDWGSFLGTSGGTVEYYQTASTGNITLPTTYTLPGGGTVTITGYYNLNSFPYYASNILLPNANLTVYNNFTVGYSAGGGTSSCITQINPGAASTTLEVHGNININQYGILQYMNVAAEYVIADNDINVAAGGALQVRNGGSAVANSLTVYGNIVNNGIFDLDPAYPSDTYYCTLLFTGSSSKSVTSTSVPTRTYVYNMTVNKGASRDSVLNVNVDTTGARIGGGGLILQNGTFRLTTKVAMNLSTGAFTIPSTACLSANGGTFNVATASTAAADLSLLGRLEVLAGTVNVGPAVTATNSYAFNIVYASAGAPELVVSDGFLNVFTQIRRGTSNTSGSLNYTQTGGIVTVGGKNADTSRGLFEVLNTGSKFIMNGGTLIIAKHNSMTIPYDLDLEPETSNVTGGTIQFGLSTSVTTSNAFYFQSSCSLGSITLEATTNSSTTQEIYPLTLVGNLTIGGTTGFYNTNGLDLEIGGNLTNNNTNTSTGLSVGGFQTQALTQTTSFLGNADQTIAGTSSNRTNFANLEVATAQSHSLFLSNGKSYIIVNGDLTLTSGVLNDSGNTISLLNNVDNAATHVSPTTSGGMVFAGTANQAMTGSGNGVFGNIEINNGTYGVDMTDNATISGQLKFTSGFLYIDDYALTFGLSATISGTMSASNMILLNGVLSDKGVTKLCPNGASSFTFPVGANGKYTPASFVFSSNTNPSGATLKVIPVDGLQPSIPDTTTNYLNYYWYVATTGFSSSYAYSVTHTYTYINTDVEGSPVNIERFDNTTAAWSAVTGTISSPTFIFTSTTLLDGSYTIGDLFKSLPTLYSIKSGSWSDVTLWSESSGGATCNYVPNGNPVVIRSVDSVALSANGANAAAVAVNGVLDALNTTFHNIGQVSGSGKIKLLSTSSGMFVFPAGSYDSFLADTASTIEFYGSINGTLPLDPGNATKPYQNVVFSGTGIKYISSVDMKVKGNLTLVNGAQLNNTQYNKDVTLLGNWIDNNTTTSGFVAGTGAVRFSGTTQQKIIMASGTMTETFYDLAVNNAAGLTLKTGNAAVGDQLILTSGNITTGSSDTLTITNTSTSAVTGGGVNSFVNGPLRKKIINGSSFRFPVGDASSSGRNRIGYVLVSNTSTTGTQTWTAQFFDKNSTTDGYDVSKAVSPLNSVVANEYWTVAGPVGGSASVSLNWDQYTGMSSMAVYRALAMIAEWGTPTASYWNAVGKTVSDYGQDSGMVTTSALVGLDTHIFSIGASAPLAAVITSIKSGLWNSSSTWDIGRIPGLYDTVVVSSPYRVALNITSAIGQFMVNSGGTYSDSSYKLTVTGNVTIGGIWVGTGTLSMTTSGDTLFGTGTASGSSVLEIAGGNKYIASSASLTLKKISILAGDTLNNLGSITADTLTGSDATSIFNNLAGSTLTINGPLFSPGTLSATVSPNTVVYNGTSAQTVNPVTYCTLKMNNGGAKTAASSFNVNNDLYLNRGSNLTVGSGVRIQVLGKLYTAGTLTNNGHLLVSN